MSITNTIGDRIKKVRLKKKLSQLKLAKLADSSQQEICLFESSTRIPSEKILQRLCNALNINIAWLRYGVGKEANEVELLRQEVNHFRKMFFALSNYLQVPRGIFNKEELDKIKLK